jgi:hypothetical protein
MIIVVAKFLVDNRMMENMKEYMTKTRACTKCQ